MAMAEKFPKEQELYRVISQCAYRNHSQVATDAANILYNYPKLFNPLITQTSENGVIKQLLELKGELPIKYKGSTYSIITSIQFPFIYSDAPAVIRIYNPDISKFSVNQYFIQGASQDQSVVNIHNTELQSWYQHRSIARVMVALVRELEGHFPFFNRAQQNSMQLYMQSIRAVQQPPNAQAPYQYQNQPQQYYQNQTQGYNYQYQNNPPNYYNNQTQPYNPYATQQQQPYAPQQQQPQAPGYYQQSNIQTQVEYKLKEKCNQILSDDLNQIQNDFKILHQHHDRLIDEVTKQETKKMYLQNLENQIEQSIQQLENENKKLSEFVDKNDVLELNEETLFQNIRENDQFSTSILELYSDIQACRETLHFIVTKFKNFNLPFETVIKMTRKYSEEQFNNILLLKKYTSPTKKL
ncbi:unnamed protein product (macronuclear) [Paramecium tetraurelia]|uniref:UEV domain-containing protein n=1 Tax=Paramecium tetraurelia TaxID=5888 RepID=A0BV93_PARTE|nr:uncharacterized protein GSPATT00005706001 [Paramecium tetraurelia]CAK62460.1 unnamed protein product [Paramecium tetraurelia]|eukprot:XP_001429858.1 hypothetical protein (macronuclear) [Paramecium tetraurelia strain d4-2]